MPLKDLTAGTHLVLSAHFTDDTLESFDSAENFDTEMVLAWCFGTKYFDSNYFDNNHFDIKYFDSRHSPN